MTKLRIRLIASTSALLVALVGWACSSEPSSDLGSGVGGAAPNSSGAPTGGVSATGGAFSPTGGLVGAGGRSDGGAISKGGAVTTAGNSSTGAALTGGANNASGGGGGKSGTPGGKSGKSPGGATGSDSAGGATDGAPAGGAPTGTAPSAGCGKAAGLMNGRQGISVSGTMREFILKLPNNYDMNKPYRLVFGWHWLGGSAQNVASQNYYGLVSPSADTAIFVAPEGTSQGGGQGGSLGWWNSGGSDIEFLKALLTSFRANLCIDENRIFSTGFSFGGMFSFSSGCSPNGMMRAIAPMAGNAQVSRCESGSRPVATMGFHGTNDSVVDIGSGRKGRDIFVQRNGCSTQTTPVSPSWCDGLNTGQQPCSCVQYQGCQAGYPVIWCEYNGPHQIAPNSSKAIWEFFKQF